MIIDCLHVYILMIRFYLFLYLDIILLCRPVLSESQYVDQADLILHRDLPFSASQVQRLKAWVSVSNKMSYLDDCI